MFSKDLAQAVNAIDAGGVVAYPTEAVYGLGCNPDNREAVAKLLALKQRDDKKGLILIAHKLDVLMPYCEMPDAGKRLAAILNGWPGARTWLLPAKARAHTVNGGSDKVAVRVTAHPVAAALCRACGCALVSTSANISGFAAARTVAGVYQIFGKTFGHSLDAVLSGSVGGRARPTEILDAHDGRVIRAA